jgi:hypothetical protein
MSMRQLLALDERTRRSSASWPEYVPSWNLFNVALRSSAKCGSTELAHLLNQRRLANTAWGQGWRQFWLRSSPQKGVQEGSNPRS